MLPHPAEIVDRLKTFQAQTRHLLIQSRAHSGLDQVARTSSADTIYTIDAVVEPLIERFFEEWGRSTPLVLIAEGLIDKQGNEGNRTFPTGASPQDAEFCVIVDPIDGTRGLMYDKRSAWALAGVAPNKGSATQLRDIEVAVMTELPTSKAGYADVLWAIRGQRAKAERVNLQTDEHMQLTLRPSSARTIDHGFAAISSFFPGTKVMAAELMEQLTQELLGPMDVATAAVFDDQYISTGGQFYELMVGHDRFNADLRPLFYRAQHQPPGLCCHPYDCAAMLIAEEAGVVLTDGLGEPLDGPMDVTSPISWAGFANIHLQQSIEPLVKSFLIEQGLADTSGRVGR